MGRLVARLQRTPLLGDGAMGTLLFTRGVAMGVCLEALNVTQPALIQLIHTEYARAGAELLTTHTFGANRIRLEAWGLEEQVSAFNRAAVAHAHAARAAIGRDLWVAGNVGPAGKRVAWEDAAEADAVAAAFREQIGVLAQAGVDLLLFETFSDVDELLVAVRVARELCALPIVASVSYGEDALTLAGQDVASVTTRLVAAGVEVVGANCSVGPNQMVATMRAMRAAAPTAIFSVSPNAGLPERDADGALYYPVAPETFASFVPQFVALGAGMVGGCCGTTPAHVAAMRAALPREA